MDSSKYPSSIYSSWLASKFNKETDCTEKINKR